MPQTQFSTTYCETKTKQKKSIPVERPAVKVFKGVKSDCMRMIMKQIMVAPSHELELRKKDPKAIFRHPDRNKAVKVMWDTMNGNASGTCFKEAEVRFNKLKGTRKQIRLKFRLIVGINSHDADHPSKAINHSAIVYIDEEFNDSRRWRYESYANGKEFDILLLSKYCHQQMVCQTICDSSGCSMNDIVEFITMMDKIKELIKEYKGPSSIAFADYTEFDTDEIIQALGCYELPWWLKEKGQ